MTTSTGTPQPLAAAPALTVDEVVAAIACPLCAEPTCAHDLARLRLAVRLATEANREA